jgi:hypothetical protein
MAETEESRYKERRIMAKERPIGVTILAILALFGAFVSLIYTLQALHILPYYLGPIAFWDFSLIAAIMWGFIFFIWLGVFQMLMTMHPSGWLFCVIIAGLSLFFDFLAVLGGSSWEAMAPGMLLSGIVLIYCLLPGTKKAFGLPA